MSAPRSETAVRDFIHPSTNGPVEDGSPVAVACAEAFRTGLDMLIRMPGMSAIAPHPPAASSCDEPFPDDLRTRRQIVEIVAGTPAGARQ